jgi:plasmid stabilization system protein ParE
MKRYRVSKDAERDLDEIFVYWAERAGIAVADRLIDAILERMHPPAGHNLIYYRKAVRGVEIAHVFHGARDQRKAWLDRSRRR